MRSWSHALDRAGQLLFIVMCLVVIAVGVKYLRASGGELTAERPFVSAGADLPGAELFNLENSNAVVVLALSSRCRYCTESMPFYRTLLALPSVADQRLQVSVGSMDDTSTMQAYLGRHGISVKQVVPLVDAGLRVRSTPTVILANSEGKVVQSWEGLLDADKQREVIAEVTRIAAR